jgi:hypothetical protein
MCNLPCCIIDEGTRTRLKEYRHLGCYVVWHVFRLLITANVVPSSPILVVLMMEATLSFETSVLITATQRNIPEDDIIQRHRRENPKSYNDSPVFVAVILRMLCWILYSFHFLRLFYR